MKEYSFKDRFKYWLDNEMSKGTVSIIRILAIAVLSVVVFVSILMFIFKLRDDMFSAFWDSMATTINAWMPSSEDGEAGYLILNALTAIIGLLFTSILIGVVSSGIEEKLEELKNGNSRVLEKNHTVILGYNIGEHGLLNQLLISEEKEKRVFVILTDVEKPEVEKDITENLEIPENVRVICRNGDITRVNDLRCCSIDKCKLIIINALNNNKTVQALLAVSALLKEYEGCHPRIISCVSDDEHLLPAEKIRKKNMMMIKTDDTIAKIIARTSTEPGLSVVFNELLNYEDNEFYFEKDERFTGKTVSDLNRCLEKATMMGIKRDGKVMLNPDRKMFINEDDELILFEESKGSYLLEDSQLEDPVIKDKSKPQNEEKGLFTIFGYNDLLDTILDELPATATSIMVITDDERAEELAEDHPDREIQIHKNRKKSLEKIAAMSSHIVVLSDRDADKEDSDVQNMLLILKLENLREINGYRYNITSELNLEGSRNVTIDNDNIDYVVSSNIGSLLLAQMAVNPDLEPVFEEILSEEGNELYSKPLSFFNLEEGKEYLYHELKQTALYFGYTLLGYSIDDDVILNPGLKDKVEFKSGSHLFVLGRE